MIRIFEIASLVTLFVFTQQASAMFQCKTESLYVVSEVAVHGSGNFVNKSAPYPSYAGHVPGCEIQFLGNFEAKNSIPSKSRFNLIARESVGDRLNLQLESIDKNWKLNISCPTQSTAAYGVTEGKISYALSRQGIDLYCR